MSTQAEPVAVIVPVHLAAYCVGTVDANEATSGFAGASTDYRDPATPKTGGFIGDNVYRGLDVAPLNRLEVGVHLHWALPKAMIQGEAGDDQLTFPAVPNRWLVSRLLIKGDRLTARHWVVMSDSLDSSPPPGQVAVTLPVRETDGAMGYRYVGRSQALESYGEDTVAQPGKVFASATGASLSAVASGMPFFAAFYPDCRSVFGFHDTLSDVTESGDIDLSYVVSGWYADPSLDIVAGVKTATELSRRHGWVLAADPLAPISICHGVTQAIVWNPNRQYIRDQPSQGSVQADVALANTTAEVMSTYYRNKLNPDVEMFEVLLTALQYGLLDQLATPRPDQLAELRDALLKSQFAQADAGIVYRIDRPSGEDATASDALHTSIPTGLADDLNALNLVQEQVDRSADYLDTYKWQMFADWYRIFKAGDDTTRNAACQIASRRHGAWGVLSGEHATRVAALQAALKGIQDRLPANLELKTAPADRYFRPTEPAILLALSDAAILDRSPGARRSDGVLETGCRTPDQVVTGLAIAGTTIDASRFPDAVSGIGSQIPYAGICAALIEEACLLNSELLAAMSGQPATAVAAALGNALNGLEQSLLTDIEGTLPESLSVSRWAGNPWMPLMISYRVAFQPVWNTLQNDRPVDYGASFFKDNYTIDPVSAPFVTYTPRVAPIDPAKSGFEQRYAGAAILSTVAPARFAKQLAEFTARHPDETLGRIEGDLKNRTILVQPLSGLAQSFLMREQSLQLPILAEPGSVYAPLTQAVAGVAGAAVAASPAFNGYFNPLRGGWMKLTLELVDVFGARRGVEVANMYTSLPMTASSDGKLLPSVAYLPPRLAQEARLLFRWVSAGRKALEESGPVPATTPICGWIMTDHLDLGFFLYSQDGLPLGQLFLNGDSSRIMWQAAPGDEDTISETIQQTMASADPVFRDMALALATGSIAFFKAFWKAVDSAYGMVASARSPGAGYAWLVGRPVAVAQADLRLDLRGMEALNESFDTIDSEGGYNQTGNGITGIEFPVTLGALDRLDDGLIGYFLPKANGEGADFSTFYSAAGSGDRVVAPVQGTLTLTATPRVDGNEPPKLDGGAKRVLMLVEPHAPVRATSGILPTAALELPPDLVANVLSNIELWFRAAPVVRGERLLIPAPRVDGFASSFVEAFRRGDGTPFWSVDSQLQTPTGSAVWGYTPQTISEGWLRFNQQNLRFTIADKDGKAILTGGEANDGLRLILANDKPGDMTFQPGDTPVEGQKPGGSVFYVHLGAAVAPDDVSRIRFSAPGWTFVALADPLHGAYWAATPSSAAVTLEPRTTLAINVDNLVVPAGVARASIGYHYYDVNGTSDGVFTQSVTIRARSV